VQLNAWSRLRHAAIIGRTSPPSCKHRSESDPQDARHLFKELHVTGVDDNDVVATLEREGIETFVTSFNQLRKGIADKRHRLATAA
jgi:transaldolase